MKKQVFTVSTTQRLTLRCMAVIAMEKTIRVRSTLFYPPAITLWPKRWSNL